MSESGLKTCAFSPERLHDELLELCLELCPDPAAVRLLDTEEHAALLIFTLNEIAQLLASFDERRAAGADQRLQS